MTKIYALLDESRQIKYVGKTTTSLERRLTQHVSGWRERTSPVNVWLGSLTNRPEILLLEEVSDEQADAAEAYWVRLLSQLPVVELLNVRLTGQPLDEATKRKISNAQRGMPRPYLHGRTVSIETRAKISESNTGKKRTSEQRQLIREKTMLSQQIPTFCDVCNAGPFKGNAGVGSHKSKRHKCGNDE